MASPPFQMLESDTNMLELYDIRPWDDLPLYTDDPGLHEVNELLKAKDEPGLTLPQSPLQMYAPLLPMKTDMKQETREAPSMVGLTMLQSLSQTNYSNSLCAPSAPSAPFQADSLFDEQPMQQVQEQVDLHSWENARPSTWSSKQVMSFVHWVAGELNFGCDFRGEKFQTVTGGQLSKMTMPEFHELDPKYGQQIFDLYGVLLIDEPQQHFDDLTYLERPVTHTPVSDATLGFPDRTCSPVSSGYASEELPKGISSPYLPQAEEDKSKAKRKRRASSQRSGPHLWEFIRNLLLDEKYSKIIGWEDREHGIFRIVHSEAVAKLWGRQKSNSKMSYEKLSRALRHYYRRHILDAVPGKRLVYKFGIAASGWKK